VNVNASNITTSGNAWGGLAVYVSKPYPSGVGRGSNNVILMQQLQALQKYRVFITRMNPVSLIPILL
jgi:hypothetical protein